MPSTPPRSRRCTEVTAGAAARHPPPSSVVSATLVARGVTVSFGDHLVLDDVDVVVAPRDRIGLVAPNGTGKSTLLRVLAGQHVPDRGSVTLAPPSATVGYLPQEPDRRAGEDVRAFLARRTGVAAAQTELHRATAAVAEAEPDCAGATTLHSLDGSRSAAQTSMPASGRSGRTSVSRSDCSIRR